MKASDYIANLNIKDITISNHVVWLRGSGVDYFNKKEDIKKYMKRVIKHLKKINENNILSCYDIEFCEYASYLPIKKFQRKEKLKKLNEKLNEKI